MSIQSQEAFIQAIKDIKSQLTDIGFSHLATTKKGYATYVDFRSADKTQISFMFGPSDWKVEILLTTDKKKYSFKNLLEIPLVVQWTRNNKFQLRTNGRVKEEVEWYVELLAFVIKEQPWTN